jgi:hypothetical protein
MAIADINGDGLPDVITANHGYSAPATLFVLYNAPDSTRFTSQTNPPPQILPSPSGRILYIYGLDLNGDGRADVVATTHPYGSPGVVVAYNQGFSANNPYLAAATMLPGPSVTETAGFGVLGQNSMPSLVTTDGIPNAYSQWISLFQGPSYSSPLRLSPGNEPRSPRILDINGDGAPDLVIDNTLDRTLAVYFGDPATGQLNLTPFIFSDPNLLSTDHGPGGATDPLTVGDLDNNGVQDVVFVVNRIIWIRNVPSQNSQSITFGPLVNLTYGAAPFALSATATSGLPVAYASNTPSVCSVSGAAVSIMGAGTCSITATQGGSAGYATATPVTISFTVSPASQTITFGVLPTQSATSQPFSLSALASSGLAVTFTATGNCAVSGSIVTITGAGNCTITASQPGNGNYNPATSVTQTFAIWAVVTMGLHNASGVGLSGGVASYLDGTGAWQMLCTTASNGTCSATAPAGTSSFQMTVSGRSVQKVVTSLAAPISFTTTQLTLQFSDAITYLDDTGASRSFQKPTMELLPTNYTVQFGGAGSLAITVGSTPVVLSVAAERLLNSSGAALLGGSGQYYLNSWQACSGGTNNPGYVLCALTGLVSNASFSMTYASTRQQMTQNIATNSTVVFQTKAVTLTLENSSGNLMDTGTAQYYSGSWLSFGQTSGGQVQKELLPGTYTFSMTYASTQQQISQNIGTNPVVVFQTAKVVSASNTCTYYYASAWLTFTSGMELLPGKYTFRFNDGTSDTQYPVLPGVVNTIH